MTKETAIEAATKVANEERISMVVANDPISNAEDEDGTWNFCPNFSRRKDGKLILFPHAKIEIVIHPT